MVKNPWLIIGMWDVPWGWIGRWDMLNVPWLKIGCDMFSVPRLRIGRWDMFSVPWLRICRWCLFHG